jgi:hypothetical protein
MLLTNTNRLLIPKVVAMPILASCEHLEPTSVLSCDMWLMNVVNHFYVTAVIFTQAERLDSVVIQ